MPEKFLPTLPEVQQKLLSGAGNTIPVYREIQADLLTPVSAYLKVAHGSAYSFLLESVAGGERVGRYSFVGANPYKVIKTGPGFDVEGDPLKVLEPNLSEVKYVPVRGVPSFTGGAVGYVSFDCVRHFEPRTGNVPLKDVLKIPEAVFLFCDTLVIFDHAFHLIKVVAHVHLPTFDESTSEQDKAAAIAAEYSKAQNSIRVIAETLSTDHIPLPEQKPIRLGNKAVSNIGQEGYEGFVKTLKHHIYEGDIIQAVPSQRLARATDLHPFNLYRRLRCVNPSPYMFYIDLKDFQIVGASPETLVKVINREVETHPVAGTRRRGATAEEDLLLEQELLASEKERAEHIMLVDLGRNDVNRVCIPATVRVEDLMHVQRYSHVMHIVSRVLGMLRPECSALDALRSIFPAGTVSGAPKIRAIELITEQEKEKRGVYAGAIGYFSYSGDIDTCIAIRTMLLKDGTAYLQAGGGIVFDSEPTAEFEETLAKLNSNNTALAQAEEYYSELQQLQQSNIAPTTTVATTATAITTGDNNHHDDPTVRRSKRRKSGQ